MSEKTVSVSLKIEEMFRGESDIVIDFEGQYGLMLETEKAIRPKLEFYSMDERSGLNIGTLKDGESRQTIIEALWKYQKSILPKGFFLNDLEQFRVNINDSHYAFIANYYDPETRVITITRFEGGK